MKQTILLAAALLWGVATQAQFSFEYPKPAPETPVMQRPVEQGRIYRTEVTPYDKRHDADARNIAGADARIAFEPVPFACTADAYSGSTVQGSTCVWTNGVSSLYLSDTEPIYKLQLSGDAAKQISVESLSAPLKGMQHVVAVKQELEIPYVWTDGVVYLHLENVGSAYTLKVNGQEVAEVEDPTTPSEFALTPFIKQGKNTFELLLRPSIAQQINAQHKLTKAFENSYLYTQNKRSIRDFVIALRPDSTGQYGVLDLKVVAQNGYDTDETVTIGYDIYSPQGKLLDLNIRDFTIPARMTDTLHFTPFIYHTNENKWMPGKKNPPLYKVMLFTRRDGTYREYMPLQIGFGKTEFIDGHLMRFGKELTLNKSVYNAAATKKTTLADLTTLRAKGINTICPTFAQPNWFYDACDELGLYVIDCANIDAPEKRNDRTVEGTPSNDPKLADEYLQRVKAMYYRSRNHTCVIAYALGGESGNGYNMYKAYEWLKSVEKSRPVIYVDAGGEWNSDL